MHYCYGLSVVHSHLLAGAGLVLTDLSVVDECFWRAGRDAGATSFAGVPYTFDLLDRSGFAERGLPTLRYVTQAGGRLAPERVRDVRRARARARLGPGRDVRPDRGDRPDGLAAARTSPTTRPGAIGVPIPGGSFRLEPVARGRPSPASASWSTPGPT